MHTLYLITLILAIVGSINWGLVGIANLNLVTLIFGRESLLTKIVYSLVGFSGLYVACYVFLVPLAKV